jgi:hypothetical protein
MSRAIKADRKIPSASRLTQPSREFDEPIPLQPNGRELVTLGDAGTYIAKLPKAEHEAPEWQAAMQALILVARRSTIN